MVRWLLVAIIVAATALGEVLQSVGMRHHGEVRDFRPNAVGRLLKALAKNRYIVFSMVCMALSFFAFMALVSVSPISFAVPVTAVTIAIETVIARFLLKENVDWKRWAGAWLVICGAALLAL